MEHQSFLAPSVWSECKSRESRLHTHAGCSLFPPSLVSRFFHYFLYSSSSTSFAAEKSGSCHRLPGCERRRRQSLASSQEDKSRAERKQRSRDTGMDDDGCSSSALPTPFPLASCILVVVVLQLLSVSCCVCQILVVKDERKIQENKGNGRSTLSAKTASAGDRQTRSRGKN